MPTNRVLRLLSVAAIAPLLLTSCDSNNPFDPSDDAAGTYSLTIYADRSVPVTFPCDPGQCGLTNGGTFRVNDGTIVLSRNGTFVETNHYTTTPSGGSAQPTTFHSEGTYEIFGDQIEFYAPPQNGFDERIFNGIFEYADDDIRISYEEDGATYEYIRPS